MTTISTTPTSTSERRSARRATPRRRRLLVSLCLATVALSLPTAHALASSPEDTVRSTADRALEILADDALSKSQKTEQLASLLDQVTDFETASKLVLARGWNDFDEAQREEFRGLLRDYLVARYRDRVDDYAGEKVQIVGGRPEARGDYTVRSKISGGGRPQPIFVDYRLRKDDAGKWRVIDVIGEDISIVSNLRSQFQSLLSRGGPDKLISTLRAKIESGEVEKAPDGKL